MNNINNITIIVIILILIIFSLSNNLRQHFSNKKNLTIVTGYFKINRTRTYETYTQGRKTMPKDSDSVYKEWMKGLLSYKGPMIIFTDKNTYNYIKKLRKGLPTKMIKTKIQDLEAYKYFKDNEQTKNYGTMVWKEGNDTNINKQLFTVWNSKFSLLKKAVDMNPFNTKYFSWYDIGYLRTVNKRLDNSWPDNEKLKILDGKVLFNIVYGGPSCKEGGSPTGGYIGCNTKNIHKVHKIFLEYLKKRIKENKFAGNDQEIMGDLRCKNQDLIQGVKGLNLDYWPSGNGHVGGAWFHMIPFFYKKKFGLKKCGKYDDC